MAASNGIEKHKKKRVAILGAGITGITSLKVFAEHPDELDLTCYEKSATYGGEWNYTEDTTLTETTRPSAMYKYLKTNSHSTTNSLPGLDIAKTRQWNTHTEIMDYLHQYVKFFNLTKYIQFETKVKQVTCLPQKDGNELWQVTIETKDGVQSQNIFDAVIVGTGPWQQPNFPHYEGEEKFKGEIIHSCQYRTPENYTDKVVLTVGQFTSGQDITNQICQFAKKVYCNMNLEIVAPENLEVTNARYVHHFTENSVVMEDGQELMVDAVVWCTGYRTEFPILDDTCSVENMEGLIYPVYRYLVHAKHPTLFFNSLFKMSPNLTLIGIACQTQCNILLGKVELPSEQEMIDEIQTEIAKYREAKRPLKMMSVIMYLDGTFKIVRDVCTLGNIPYPEEKMAIQREIFWFGRNKLNNKFREHDLSVDENGKVVRKLLPPSEVGLYVGFE